MWKLFVGSPVNFDLYLYIYIQQKQQQLKQKFA